MGEILLSNTGRDGMLTPITDTILEGYAKNGELSTFDEVPRINDRELYDLQDASYATIFYEVIKKFLGGALPDDELRRIAEESYSPDLFDFDEGCLRTTTTPSGIYVVGLSDGPTGSFKDMGMQPFARLVEAIRKNKAIVEQLIIAVSTSGDTLPAGQQAFKSIDNVSIVGMFPSSGTSSVQRAQMVGAHNGRNIHSIEVDADFTKINDIHIELNKMFELGAINSVNVARLITQMAYHVAAYLQAIKKSGGVIGDEVDVAIPSGNFGNGLAAISVRNMDVPIGDIIITTNENDILAQYFLNNKYPHLPKNSEKKTTSSAQDIRNASNWWRLADWVYGGRNAEIYEQWEAEGAVVDLNQFAVKRPEFLRNIKATTVDELARHAMMWEVWEDSDKKTMIDPHTANAIVGAERFRRRGRTVIAYETAKPWKFPEVMKYVLGEEPEVPDRCVDVISAAEGKEVPRAASAEDLSGYFDSIGVKRK